MRISRTHIRILIAVVLFLAGIFGITLYVQSRGTAAAPRSAPQPASAGPDWSLTPVSSAPASPADGSSSDGFDYTTAATAIAKQGFSISQGPGASGSKGPLRAFVVICTGSEDGHCGTVDFFYVNNLMGFLPARRLGTSEILPYNARIVTEGGQYVTIDFDISRSRDPLCCTTGGTISVTYRWTGQGISISGPQAAEAPTISPPGRSQG